MMNQLVGVECGAMPDRLARCLRGLVCGILAGVSALVSGCAAFDEWGRTKVYRPTLVTSEEKWQAMVAEFPGAQTFFVASGPVAGERVAVLRVPALGSEVAAAQPINVLYLHGTFRHAAQNLPKTVPMAQVGMTVFVPDYRGWGLSSARLPSETSINEDAWVVWQALQKAQTAGEVAGGPPAKWVIYGHSMGSAVAVELAAKLHGEGRYCALVLESSFTDFSDVAFEAAGLPGRWLVAMGKQRMDAKQRIGLVSPPVWFLHGENDHTVPISLGKRLFDAAPAPKHWSQWPLRHSNLHTDPTGRYDQVWQQIRTACEAP